MEAKGLDEDCEDLNKNSKHTVIQCQIQQHWTNLPGADAKPEV